jgi:uncharacterized protein YndB with AHSA1/START domain
MAGNAAGYLCLQVPGRVHLTIIPYGLRANRASSATPPRVSIAAVCRAERKDLLSPEPCVWFPGWPWRRWAPKSFGVSFLSCEADVRTGGTYRFVFSHAASEQPMAFFGKYIEVTPPARLVWTNEESDEGAVTTVTFEEKGGRTLLVLHELHPSKEAVDSAIGFGEGLRETFKQLDELLVTLGASR